MPKLRSRDSVLSFLAPPSLLAPPPDELLGELFDIDEQVKFVRRDE